MPKKRPLNTKETDKLAIATVRQWLEEAAFNESTGDPMDAEFHIAGVEAGEESEREVIVVFGVSQLTIENQQEIEKEKAKANKKG